MIQKLKKLVVKLSMTGTLEVVEQPFQLHKDSYGFVKIRCLVPVTPNSSNAAVCTVHRQYIDVRGNRVTDEEKFPLAPFGRVTLGGLEYRAFEAWMPASFTEQEGNLTIIFNYMDAVEIGGITYASDLITAKYDTTVSAGGYGTGEIVLTEKESIVAKIGEIEQTVSDLVQPPSLIENGGEPDVEIGPEGNLVFYNLKGEAGEGVDQTARDMIENLVVTYDTI